MRVSRYALWRAVAFKGMARSPGLVEFIGTG